MLKKIVSGIFLFVLATFYAQNINCKKPRIANNKDFPKEIPGKTMGQKLESLLFWSQAERQRRFPLMQTIYPSTIVESGNSIYPLEQSTHILPNWKDQTTLKSYIEDNHVSGIIVIQNNKIKLEVYNKDINKNTLWTSFSVAKSISSMLVGVALKSGDIKSMDDELQTYIPEFKGYDYGKVSVRQLLTMTSGIGWNEDYTNPESDVAQMYRKNCEEKEAHIISYMKNLKQEYLPGTHWNYSTGETDLVGILVQKASGKNLGTYLSEKIWKPFGMQQCAYWLADECSGLNIGGSGLSASLRDYARLGILMLENGKINNESIFSDEWLSGAASDLIKTNDKGGSYGYLWWKNNDGSYAAFGIFGQMLYINPQKKIVIAQMAAWPEATGKSLSRKRQDFIDAVIRVLD